MYRIKNLKRSSFVRWVFLNLNKKANFSTGSCHTVQNPRFYSTKTASNTNSFQLSNDLLIDRENFGLWSNVDRREAEDALFEYLHSTRNLKFMDAENISRNSPRFLLKLLKTVENKEDIEHSITRFLRYHPINEFEPFFESMGLKPSDFSMILPRNLMFLSDDKVLVENYHVFCEYGFVSYKIGKIYKEAKEVFRYNDGVLYSRLLGLQNVVLDKSSVIKLVGSCPSVLIGDEMDVLKVLMELKAYGNTNGWFIEHLSKEDYYDWKRILELLGLFKKLGFEDDQLGRLILENPTILLQNSGSSTTSIIGLLVKFGYSKKDILSLFLDFPKINARDFVSNVKRSYNFLKNIEMEVNSIGELLLLHPNLLGSCSLKAVSTALNCLNCGKKRLCEIIKKNPQELKNLALRSNLKPLPFLKLDKSKFLLDIGFIKNSIEMKRALKRLRGTPGELQERFDYLVNSGFDHNDLVEMMKSSPQFLNQKKKDLEIKINFFVNDLGYSLSSSSLSYAIFKDFDSNDFSMFTSEDSVFLENYLAFLQYGFPRDKITKIYNKNKEVFRYNDGVLFSRLRGLQNVVLDKSIVIKFVELCPSILIGNETDVLKVLMGLKTFGIANGWFIQHFSKGDYYSWKHILELLCFFKRLGCDKEHLGRLIHKNPTILLQNSGTITTSIIGFLLKFGASKNDIQSVFLNFPEMKVEKYVSNLRRSYHFLMEIQMDFHSIGKLFCAHPHLLGSCSIKGAQTTLNLLKSGKKRLCELIRKNPQELKNLSFRLKVKPLPSSKLDKKKVFLEMGFLENSMEIERALKRFSGTAMELQERVDCLVNAGFDQKDVIKMLKSSPQIINQTKEVIEMKIDFLVNDLGYPLSCIAKYLSSLSYAIEKVKLRCTMYNWLVEQGTIKRMSLSTLLACSEKQFITRKVSLHPKGIEVFEGLKRQIYP